MITAAHCQNPNDPIAQVVLGQDDLDKDPQGSLINHVDRFLDILTPLPFVDNFT